MNHVFLHQPFGDFKDNIHKSITHIPHIHNITLIVLFLSGGVLVNGLGYSFRTLSGTSGQSCFMQNGDAFKDVTSIFF